MSSLLHYPRSSCSINDLAKMACTQDNPVEKYTESILNNNSHINNVEQKIKSSQGIILPGENAKEIKMPQCSAQEHQVLAALSHAIGGASTVALAGLYNVITPPNLYGNLTTFSSGGGAAASANAKYILDTIAEYDAAVKAKESLVNHRATDKTVEPYRRRERKAFKKMSKLLDKKGQDLLHKNTFKTRRVKNLRGRVVTESIPVSSVAEVKSLERLARAGRVLGPGLVVLDGGLRANGVYKKYKANDPGWKREAVVQSAGFVAGLGTAGTIGLLVMMLVPGGFLLAVAAGGIAAMGSEWLIKELAGSVYDKLF